MKNSSATPRSLIRLGTDPGMTLVEILATMAIVSTVLLTLVVLFAESIGTVHKSQTESVAIFIAENVHARLMTDPEWPTGIADRSFSREVDEHGMPRDKFVYEDLYFDADGIEVKKDSDPNAAVGFKAYQGILTFSRSPNYNSPRLDFVALEVKSIGGPEMEPITFSFQRVRSTTR